VFLTDSPEEARKKVMRAITGGGATLEEHRKYGGKPEKCSVYEFFAYHLIDDDKYLKEIYETCRSGERICGKCKKEAATLVEEWMREFSEKREWAKGMVDEILKEE
jgi:tryptophanyl-tRNA synthetase